MNRITQKQLEIYDALAKFIKKNGFSPTYDELARLTNRKSKSTVFDKINQLKSKGYVSIEEGQSRTIRIIKEVSEEERERLKQKFEYAY